MSERKSSVTVTSTRKFLLDPHELLVLFAYFSKIWASSGEASKSVIVTEHPDHVVSDRSEPDDDIPLPPTDYMEDPVLAPRVVVKPYIVYSEQNTTQVEDVLQLITNYWSDSEFRRTVKSAYSSVFEEPEFRRTLASMLRKFRLFAWRNDELKISVNDMLTALELELV